MKRLAWRALALTAVVTIARLTTYAIGKPSAAVANRAYVLALGALAAWVLLTLIGRHTSPLEPGEFDDACAPPSSAAPRPARLAALEDLAAFGSDKAQGRYFHLRPYVREVVAERLAARGRALDTDPAVPTLLGPETWELVRPDAMPPGDPTRRGLTDTEILAVIDCLERLR